MTATSDHIIKPEEAITLHGIFLERIRHTPENIAYKYFDTRKNDWVTLTWMQVRDQVARWQAALLKENLAAGERVAIMLRNCPSWVIFEQAAMSLGLVVVPLYTVDRPDNIAYIVKDAGVKVLLLENEEQWQSLSGVTGQMDCVQRFVSIEKVSGNTDPRLKCADEWLPVKAAMQAERERKRDELATIIYTSGTTGKPKGVMLSHHNIVYNAYASYLVFPVSQVDCSLSFLPLSHTFERTAGYWLMIGGAQTAYARSIPLLADDLKLIRPTVLIAVPRIFERIYNAIHAKLEEGSPLKKKLFLLTIEVGWDRFEYQQGRGSWTPKMLLWPLVNKLVASKVMDRLGGRIRFSVSGGAALPPKVSRLFIALGLPLVQGYGLTETSPVVSANPIDKNFPSSVGLPFEGISVRIGPQNALMVKSPSNMLGYWHNPEATSAMIDSEGWLNTGDTARISETGHIYITGRLKEIIVLSNGEKVPPADMEAAITRDPLFDQIMVHGEGHPYLVAVAVVNPDIWKQLAVKAGVDAGKPESLGDKRVEDLVIQRISAQMKEFPGYAQIHRALLLSDPWTIENGLLTPTLKVKRAKVVEKFFNEIKSLYEGH
ncbi:MAG: long-chain fatty acid--CoA ligase [Gallionellales bacterium 35-53-114]|jgi:long-chain acyl-CoA synthetase|nr:MAG: long-chain fatty acid--CoA ligase [Gallionellales bacterium 35-53-114]OYZ65289.1 MAG: long-chain fatty acid--CoA ligase [Gallionellales bacterium 24-53-125]OZB08195.1 MAG: long-chain fatty acid--CoA ligase [Gallionellales bacterium 39-52-133]HQS58121.1 long-chain fatty acid--CoA ligase [Gallionellaceae bacterium]HQS73676.1 long-chain fatty acid--CoA ligase [Gallionellaceae bacterium]